MSEHPLAADYAPGFHRNSGEVVGIFSTHAALHAQEGESMTVGECTVRAIEEYRKSRPDPKGVMRCEVKVSGLESLGKVEELERRIAVLEAACAYCGIRIPARDEE